VQDVLVGAEAIIDEARNGRMFILVDDDDRENEGDLVIPAQMATPDAINFMARHGRGLICLALTKERVDAARPRADGRTNRSRNETAFTVSIEAREGVTTGISAADRARTIAVAIDAPTGPTRSSRPATSSRWSRAARRRAGPRRPYRGGGRRRAARRAQPVGRDLRDHARGRDHGAARRSDGFRQAPRPQDRHHPRPHRLPAEEGPSWSSGRRSALHRAQRRDLEAQVFRDKASGEEQLALVHGARSTRRSPCWCGCTASTCSPTCSARRARARAARGRDGDDRGGRARAWSSRSTPPRPARCRAPPTSRSGKAAEAAAALRGYGIGAQILAALGIHDMILLSNTRHAPVGAGGYGLAIVEERRSGRARWPILIAEARFYRISTTCCSPARARRSRRPATSHETITVPGALELPGAIALAARERRFCAFVALGVVIRGETYHFEIVAGESARGLMALTLEGSPSATASSPSRTKPRRNRAGRG
jgi:3,4-dihydroxy 2-butanone 4-phosphate synthase/GTP cyclohydrolase II